MSNAIPTVTPGHITEERVLHRKAVALLSGGLDSALAIHLVQCRGIEVVALHFTSFFSPVDASREDSPVRTLAKQLKVPLILRSKGRDFLDLLKNPRYGFGKNLNPCIDCRIYTLIKAREIMEEVGASFLVTGEVVGQRPMSQRRDTMRLIEKRAGCDGLVVRPLSAKVLPPTIPEQAGIVDRERLLAVAGRGRKVQLALARELGLTGFSPPAGGCLLTDPIFARRVRDLMEEKGEPEEHDFDLLHVGRHLRLRPDLKIIVGRREEENHRLVEHAASGTLFSPVDFPGPQVLALGRPDPEEEEQIGAIIRRYAKDAVRTPRISVRQSDGMERIIEVAGTAKDAWILERMV